MMNHTRLKCPHDRSVVQMPDGYEVELRGYAPFDFHFFLLPERKIQRKDVMKIFAKLLMNNEGMTQFYTVYLFAIICWNGADLFHNSLNKSHTAL